MEKKASRVLIVDDMPINRMILSSLLATSGVLSDQAEGGRECLSLCEKKDYDLILLDHRMPEPDGVDTLVALKELFSKKGRTVPVICHTTEEGRDNINLYKAAGFADVLIKPVDIRQLSELVMTYLPEEDRIAADEDAEAAADTEEPDKSESSISPDTREEIEKLPLWLKTIPHIDLVSGIANSGDAEDYLYSLYIFYSSISEKTDEIKTYFDSEDWTMYRLCVHSLKSMAHLIGARLLAQKAASLESSAEEGDIAAIRRDTVELLSVYRKYAEYLAPVKDDEYIRRLHRMNAKKSEDSQSADEQFSHKKSILFVHSDQGIVSKGIEKSLQSSGFRVISAPEEPSALIAHRASADIVVYYPSTADGSNVELTMNLLGELCLDDSKLLCVTGDAADLELALSKNGAQRVSRTYRRPVNIERFTDDMKYFARLLDDYRRKKTLFVVDDDENYLQVITHWLSPSYHISAFSCGKELISGISAATPDLILLDYEMPGMDGQELIQMIRENEDTKKIPVIFLTGKNDRDHVFRILEYKPDGYLLKTTQKEPLLDTIHRYFSESLFLNSRL